MKSYPKWLYHPSKPAQVVADEAAHRALGAGWVESPADVKAEAPEPEPAAPVAAEEPEDTTDAAPDVEPTEAPKKKRTRKAKQ